MDNGETKHKNMLPTDHETIITLICNQQHENHSTKPFDINTPKKIKNDNITSSKSNNAKPTMKLYFKNSNNQISSKKITTSNAFIYKSKTLKQQNSKENHLLNQENSLETNCIHTAGELMHIKNCSPLKKKNLSSKTNSVSTHINNSNSKNESCFKKKPKHFLSLFNNHNNKSNNNFKSNYKTNNNNINEIPAFTLFESNDNDMNNSSRNSKSSFRDISQGSRILNLNNSTHIHNNSMNQFSSISKINDLNSIKAFPTKQIDNQDKYKLHYNVIQNDEETNENSKVSLVTKERLSNITTKKTNVEGILKIKKQTELKKEKVWLRKTLTVALEQSNTLVSMKDSSRRSSEIKSEGSSMLLNGKGSFELKFIKKEQPRKSLLSQQQQKQASPNNNNNNLIEYQPTNISKSKTITTNAFPLFMKQIETGDFHCLKRNNNIKSDNSNSNNSVNSYQSEDIIEDDSSKPNAVYTKGPIYSINDVNAKNCKTNPENYYNELLHRYLFQNLDFGRESEESSDDEEDSDLFNGDYFDNCINICLNNKIGQLHQDIKALTSTKETLDLIEQYYQKEILRMQYELSKQSSYTNALTPPIPFPNTVDQDITNQQYTTTNQNGDYDDLISLNQSIIQRELDYKETLKSLLIELQIPTSSTSDTKTLCNEELLQEVNEFLSQGEEFLPETNKSKTDISSETPSQKQSTKMITSFKQKSSSIRKDIARELIQEFLNFKKEEAQYKFEIPFKYQMSNCVKCIKEKALKKKLIKIYENKVFEIIDKNNTIRRIFPDSYEIIFYKNKDIQQRFPNGQIAFYYHINKSCEFRYINEGFWVSKFPNGQYEKHYSNNNTDIKFENGSYRIIKPKEGELVMASNGAVVIQDKNGKVLIKESRLPQID